MCTSGSSCTPSQRAWTTDPAHQPSAKTEGTEKTLTINSHDGRSAYQLRAGLFQPVCTNRMLPALGDVGFVHVSHRRSVMPNVVDATQKITRDQPQGQQLDFAREGLALRFAGQDAAPAGARAVARAPTGERTSETGEFIALSFTMATHQSCPAHRCERR
jgi:hypothetical protein